MSKIESAQLIWDESNQPKSVHFDDIYFSRHNGLDETRYVFIKHNQLEERLKNISENASLFTIGETGFGTGLNFLCAMQTFLKCAPPYAQLHFISTEKYPLKKDDLAKALSLWPELTDYKNALIDQYPPLFPGFYSLSFADHRVRLTLLLGDANEQLSSLAGDYVDAWFLDGFAPNKNPELWNDTVLKQVARLSHTNTTFSTFTAASMVSKTLTQLGFHVEKTSGFARKREMLFGRWIQENPPSIIKPWFQRNQPQPLTKTAIVIGGGLAGTTTAWSLAKRGWMVTLIDKNNAIAQESSGNLQGIIYARLSAFNNAPNKLMVQAYHYSLCLLNQFYKNTQPDTWSPCGVLQLAFNNKEQKRYDEIVESGNYPADILQTINAEAATTLVGVSILQKSIYFPHGGWVNPPAFCKDLINHKNITLKTDTEVTQLQFDEQHQEWQLLDANKHVTAQAPVVVIANNTNAIKFEQTRDLPIKIIRGQITHLRSNGASQKLKAVVCADRYLTPERQGMHNLGASFNLKEETTQERLEDHMTNLASLQTSLPDLYAQFTQQKDNELSSLQGRVGFRATTPDYMPIVGPVPVESQFIEDYAALRYDSNAHVKKQGAYYPGLFINAAHGSRGLLTCPLSAELLAAHINHEMWPLEKEVVELLHPARFIIKDLIRRKR